MGVSGASAPECELRKTAWPLKRRGGSREPNSGYGVRECSARQGNSMRVVRGRKRLLLVG